MTPQDPYAIWIALASILLKFLTLGLGALTLLVLGVYTYFTYGLFSAQKKQGFENKFFQLLQLHHEIFLSMSMTDGRENSKACALLGTYFII